MRETNNSVPMPSDLKELLYRLYEMSDMEFDDWVDDNWDSLEDNQSFEGLAFAIREMSEDEFEEFMSNALVSVQPEPIVNIKLPETGDENYAGIVTVIEYGHKYDGIHKILKQFPWVDADWLSTKKKYFCPDKVVGQAVCHPKDRFDKNTGLGLAYDRLHAKVHGNSCGAVKVFKRDMEKWLSK